MAAKRQQIDLIDGLTFPIFAPSIATEPVAFVAASSAT
jgi:hypothetical protein